MIYEAVAITDKNLYTEENTSHFSKVCFLQSQMVIFNTRPRTTKYGQDISYIALVIAYGFQKMFYGCTLKKTLKSALFIERKPLYYMYNQIVYHFQDNDQKKIFQSMFVI